MENRGHPTQAQFRLDWVDVARGIGIIAVVIGHVWTRGPLRDAMYSFHMPFFFLLSGLLSRPHPPMAFARRQCLSQMRPYAAFLILLIAIDQIVEPLKGFRPIFHQWPHDLWPILLGGPWLRGPYTIFWFVPCLLVARILFNLALSCWPDPLDRRWGWLLLPMLVLAYALGWLGQAWPLGLVAMPMAFLLLWVGAAWPRIRWHNGMIVPLALLSILGLTQMVPTLNMKVADYGWPLLSIGSAIATSLLLFRFSARMAPYASPLAAIGRASLVIMYCHVAVIHYLTPFLARPWLALMALLLPFCAFHLIRACPPLKRLFL